MKTRRGFLLALIAIGALAEPESSGPRIVERTYAGRRRGLAILSDHLEVGVVPALGGRIVELIPRSTGKNTLHAATWNYHLGPGDKWPGAEYGGICDCPTEGWPGDFWGILYNVQPLYETDALGLQAEAETNGVHIVRQMVVPHGTSKLVVRVRQTNTSDRPKSMVLRLHGEFRIGTQADAQDVIFWKDGDVLRERRYIPGSEAPRLSFDRVTDGWSAMVDTVEREALVHRFLEPPGPSRVFFWSGHPEPPPGTMESTGDTGWYNNERFGPRTTVEPGGSLTAVEEFWALRGLGRVDDCRDEGAAALELPRERFGAGDPVVLRAAFAAPAAAPGVRVTITVSDPSGATKAVRHDDLPSLSAGEASHSEITFRTEGWPDGLYAATALFERNGKVLARVSRTFVLDETAAAQARTTVAALATRITELETAWQPPSPSDRVRLAMLRSRLSQAETELVNGNFDAARKWSESAIEQAGRDSIRRQREMAPDVVWEPDLDRVLRRYRREKE